MLGGFLCRAISNDIWVVLRSIEKTVKSNLRHQAPVRHDLRDDVAVKLLSTSLKLQELNISEVLRDICQAAHRCEKALLVSLLSGTWFLNNLVDAFLKVYARHI